MLAIFTSNIASAFVDSHCLDSSDQSPSSTVHHDGSHHSHNVDDMKSDGNHTNDGCDCDCDGNTACTVIGNSVTAMSNSISAYLIDFSQELYMYEPALSGPPDPNVLLRPPITSS